MSKERYNQIIDEAYENYSKEYEKDNSVGILFLVKRVDNELVYKKLDKESFIGLCEHDKLFSEKWGLRIEERELSLEERLNLVSTIIGEEKIRTHEDNLARVDKLNIPTKLVTVTYDNETVEIYG